MILICFGTRPEWLKIKPIIKLLNANEYRLLFTGQHEDLLSDMKVDYRIHIKDSIQNRLDQIIVECMSQFPNESFEYVLVQGDTASAFACALVAFHRKYKIIHLEAGLRSHDLGNPFPEEGYRQMISRITDIHLCPTQLSKEKLLNENVGGETYVVGNTSLDNLVHLNGKESSDNKVLVTLHRRENHNLISRWFEEIEILAMENPKLQFILPIHPNPNVQKHKHILKHVNVVEPLEHDALLDILINCKIVISDSGGIQEEASFFDKKVIVCRKVTERPEAIPTGHLYLCDRPDILNDMFYSVLKERIIGPCPYGDGYAAVKIINILRNE
jgi:UDP-N-acetylglucosamine 2-epimerase (non-hydrolysing)